MKQYMWNFQANLKVTRKINYCDFSGYECVVFFVDRNRKRVSKNDKENACIKKYQARQ